MHTHELLYYTHAYWSCIYNKHWSTKNLLRIKFLLNYIYFLGADSEYDARIHLVSYFSAILIFQSTQLAFTTLMIITHTKYLYIV